MDALQTPIATPTAKRLGSVVDLFCGAGGLSHGFFLEGFEISAGIDIDEDCRYAFESNNHAPFISQDVATIGTERIEGLFASGAPSILVGCAPCQPFSSYNQKNTDPKWRLLEDFTRLILDIKPDIVSMENVPRLVSFRNGTVFKAFENALREGGYHVSSSIAFAPDYGVPQRRSRMVLLASRYGTISLEPPLRSKETYATVRSAIGDLPTLDAGQMDPSDRFHQSSRLSDINLRRIRTARPGGTWRDWDADLIAHCHRSATGRGYSSVYGRMTWDDPSPTITTQFYGFGNGRFGHPEQDRGLTLREGAILQSFPPGYDFVRPDEKIRHKTVGRMIGNSVPVLLARAIARSISTHLKDLT